MELKTLLYKYCGGVYYTKLKMVWSVWQLKRLMRHRGFKYCNELRFWVKDRPDGRLMIDNNLITNHTERFIEGDFYYCTEPPWVIYSLRKLNRDITRTIIDQYYRHKHPQQIIFNCVDIPKLARIPLNQLSRPIPRKKPPPKKI